MTNNIEKLYELAGVKEKRGIELTVDPTNDEPKFNEHYVCYEYPPFTNTKQLEIIKWLSKSKEFWLSIDFEEVKFTELKSWAVSVEWYTENKFFSCAKTDFPQALAGLVCELWDDLTPEQRLQIHKILE